MPDLLLINDYQLLLQQSDGQIASSQGYAWMKGEQVIFDFTAEQTAVGHCRLSPQQINNRYWQQCAQSSIALNKCGMRHAADLIWQHLNEFKTRYNIDELVLVVPSHYQESNLQLLLGIAKACQIEVSGIVNKAVLLLCESVPDDIEYWHIDLQLHQTVISRLTAQQGQLSLLESEAVSNAGIQAMQDSLLKSLQAAFIQNDRFDPLHNAQTEQQLFDQLDSLALQIQTQGKASARVEHGGQLKTASIDQKQWVASLQSYVTQLNSAINYASNVYCSINGFSAFALMPLHWQLLSQQDFPAIPSSLQQANDEVVYIKQLPLLNQPTKAAKPIDKKLVEKSSAKAAATSSGAVTHLLQDGVAVQIEQALIELKDNHLTLRSANKSNCAELFKQDKIFILNQSERRDLQPNDRIGSNLADGVISAITVLG